MSRLTPTLAVRPKATSLAAMALTLAAAAPTPASRGPTTVTPVPTQFAAPIGAIVTWSCPSPGGG